MSLQGIGRSFRNFWRALGKGELLLSIGAHKYYMHILYLFVLAWISILLSLKVDGTLTRVEENKTALKDLEIYHAEKEAELVRLHSASTWRYTTPRRRPSSCACTAPPPRRNA